MTREVMTSFDSIDELWLSGRRAVFTLNDGASLEEHELADAFDEKGMELVSFEEADMPRPAATYRIDAGVT